MKVKNVAAEMTRRGAAAVANATQGRARCLDPNRRAYDRTRAKRELGRVE